MLGAARDVDGAGPCNPADQPAHGGAGVTRGVDVGIAVGGSLENDRRPLQVLHTIA